MRDMHVGAPEPPMLEPPMLEPPFHPSPCRLNRSPACHTMSRPPPALPQVVPEEAMSRLRHVWSSSPVLAQHLPAPKALSASDAAGAHIPAPGFEPLQHLLHALLRAFRPSCQGIWPSLYGESESSESSSTNDVALLACNATAMT